VLPVLALLAMEGALRLAGYERPIGAPFMRFINPDRLMTTNEQGPSVGDPLLFWRMRPNWGDGTIQFNERGYRTPSFTDVKPPGTTRIVCLGDSNTFGLGVKPGECWTRLLETHLRNRRQTDGIEVINLGVPGYSLVQGARLLEREALGFSPDVVVLAFGGVNDWLPAIGYPDSQQGRTSWWHGLRLAQLIRHLAVATPADTAAPESTAQARDRLNDLDTRDHVGPRRVPLPEFGATLTAAIQRATSAGARVILVTMPLPATTAERNPISQRYVDAVRRIARTEGVSVVDTWPLFDVPERAELFEDFCHPRADGHATIAAAVAEAVGD
jgi:lysophospholipase L1-like esterase